MQLHLINHLLVVSPLVHFNSTIYQHVGNHLVTCPYCMLWTDTSVTKSQDGATKEGRNLYLFSKSMSRVSFRLTQRVSKMQTFGMNITLVPQQSPGRCKSLT